MNRLRRPPKSKVEKWAPDHITLALFLFFRSSFMQFAEKSGPSNNARYLTRATKSANWKIFWICLKQPANCSHDLKGHHALTLAVRTLYRSFSQTGCQTNGVEQHVGLSASNTLRLCWDQQFSMCRLISQRQGIEGLSHLRSLNTLTIQRNKIGFSGHMFLVILFISSS